LPEIKELIIYTSNLNQLFPSLAERLIKIFISLATSNNIEDKLECKVGVNINRASGNPGSALGYSPSTLLASLAFSQNQMPQGKKEKKGSSIACKRDWKRSRNEVS
jgi:hypothetical protein